MNEQIEISIWIAGFTLTVGVDRCSERMLLQKKVVNNISNNRLL